MSAASATAPAAARETRRRTAGSLSGRPPELTVPRMLMATVERLPEHTVQLHKVEKQWRATTYRELGRQVRDLALGLVELGVQRGERVALLSENRPEWAVADLAILAAGAVNVPLYSTLPALQAEYILANSEARVAICSGAKQLAKVLEVRERLPALQHVLVMDPPVEVPEGVLSLGEVAQRGAATPEAETAYRRLAEAVQPRDRASIIYTSGTTGNPKGAVLTHDNFMSNAQSVAVLFQADASDTFLSFLPLSHVFERLAGHYFPLLVGATIAYAESIFAVQTNMTEVKPTVMASVPRLYEALDSRIRDGIARQPERKRRFVEWAVKVGWEYYSRRIRGEAPPLLARLQYPLAESKVLRPLRERVTGGRMRLFISGGAPLPMAAAEFLTSLGLHITEGYGLTETSPVICANRPGRTKLGTVGPPIVGVEVAIADDGEILSRGPHIMEGYFRNPQATAEAIDAEGWFHTGDLGELDEEGYLRITGRKKDILVLANGKNVAPQNIETALKASPYIANVVLFGDRQPQVVALIVPDFEHLRAWARAQGLEAGEPEALIAEEKVRRLIRAEIDRLTPHLADFEQVRRFTLLPQDFSQERNEVTPTLKIRRMVVAENYAAQIQAMYGAR